MFLSSYLLKTYVFKIEHNCFKFNVADVKALDFWRDQPEFVPTFCQTFFLPFQISYRIKKAFIFNKKMKEIIKKLKMKDSARLYCPNKVASV